MARDGELLVDERFTYIKKRSAITIIPGGAYQVCAGFVGLCGLQLVDHMLFLPAKLHQKCLTQLFAIEFLLG